MNRNQEVLDEALKFVEPEGDPHWITIAGDTYDRVVVLRDKFITMLEERGYTYRRRNVDTVVCGNTLISFVSAAQYLEGYNP